MTKTITIDVGDNPTYELTHAEVVQAAADYIARKHKLEPPTMLATNLRVVTDSAKGTFTITAQATIVPDGTTLN